MSNDQRSRQALLIDLSDVGSTGDLLSPIGLTRAIASSRLWHRLGQEVVLVVRPEPTPLLGIFGRFTPAERMRVAQQVGLLRDTLASVRYIGFDEVARGCRELADRLRTELGSAMIAESRFAAVPRGGHVVLGLLAYALGLRPEQLEPGEGNPLILVDDCALTGARFRRILAQHGGQPIVFAHLFSHPSLRESILRSESRVKAVVAARDLHGSELETAEVDDVRGSARRMTGGYWYGRTEEHVCFPWNEPDRAVFDETAGEYVQAWRVVPPELCLQNEIEAPRSPVRVEVVSLEDAPYGAAEDVLYTCDDEAVVIAKRGATTAIELRGIGASLWTNLMGGQRIEALLDRLETEYGDEAVRTDAEHFLTRLLDEGLLVHRA